MKVINISIFVLVVIFSLFVIAANYSLFGIRIFVVKSGSMEPAIKTGSLVIDKVNDEYNIGDIVTFHDSTDSSLTITHRIAEKTTQNNVTMYETKGDANNTNDSLLLSGDRIIGKERFTIPLLGYLVGFARTPLGLMILIVIPATILIYEEVNKIRKEFAIIVIERRKKREFRQEMSPKAGFGMKFKRFFSILWEVLHRTI